MKPLLFLLLLLSAFPMDAQDRRRALIAKVNADKAAGGGGGACTVIDTNLVTSSALSNVGEASGQGAGQREWNPSAGMAVCKVSVWPQTVTGDISAIGYVAKIYTTNSAGCDLGSTLLATSATLTGNNAWGGAGWIDFTFSTPFSASTSTNYDIIIIRADGGGGGGNHFSLELTTAGGTLSGFQENWVSGVCQVGSGATGRDILMKIWGQ